MVTYNYAKSYQTDMKRVEIEEDIKTIIINQRKMRTGTGAKKSREKTDILNLRHYSFT